MLKECKGVIGPDYSIYTDSPMEEQIWNTYRNRVLSYWMQQNGIEVIPNVWWGKSATYEFCFDGIPKGALLLLEQMGVFEMKWTDLTLDVDLLKCWKQSSRKLL